MKSRSHKFPGELLLQRVTILLLCVAVFTTALGCGNSANLNKNKDFLALKYRVDRMEGAVEPPEGTPVQPPAPTETVMTSPPRPALTQAPALTRGRENQYYQQAMDLYKQGYYNRAAAMFAALAEQAPSNPLAPNALYWLGECFYSQAMYREAMSEFGRVVQDYPNSTKAPDAMLKIAYSLSMLKDGPAAMAVLRELLARYPKSEAAEAVRSGKMVF